VDHGRRIRKATVNQASGRIRRDLPGSHPRQAEENQSPDLFVGVGKRF